MGRNDDMLIVRGVNVFPSQVETVLLDIKQVEPHYQLVVDRGIDLMDNLEIKVESTEASNTYDATRDILSTHLSNTLGIRCEVTILGPGEIVRSEGKAVRVIDNRQI